MDYYDNSDVIAACVVLHNICEVNDYKNAILGLVHLSVSNGSLFLWVSGTTGLNKQN